MAYPLCMSFFLCNFAPTFALIKRPFFCVMKLVVFLCCSTHKFPHSVLLAATCGQFEMRCKSTRSKNKTPLNFSEDAKNLIFVAEIAYFRRTKVSRFGQTAVRVVRKFAVRQFIPPPYKQTFKLTERKRNTVTFHAL